MPNITIDGPELKDIDAKRELVKSITGAASKAYGIPKEAFVILIKESAPENVAIGGTLLTDRAK
ncbi:MAG: 4-oxalocrotonate tautomerase DmpI [Halobacteriota archaeon]|nr:4-oxalocrotonate tautomerase DmpI [Halobacteriota archaeon]